MFITIEKNKIEKITYILTDYLTDVKRPQLRIFIVKYFYAYSIDVNINNAYGDEILFFIIFYIFRI